MSLRKQRCTTWTWTPQGRTSPSLVRTETSGGNSGEGSLNRDQLSTEADLGLFFLPRVYNVETGKLKKSLKGSSSDEGALLKVCMSVGGVIV